MTITLPTARKGRRSLEQEFAYREELQSFADAILKIKSTLDFRVSSRGWCYILEEHGLAKGDFDKAQELINTCRKKGLLPLNICAEDSARQFDCLEQLDEDDVDAAVRGLWRSLDYWIDRHTPRSFWADQPCFIQILVEKIDLVSLFQPVCKKYRVPIANARGWGDINQRADLMCRFEEHESDGRQCVLLYCGDFDPAGLLISDSLRSNLEDLSEAVGWDPKDLIIKRFGLNYDFINEQGLSWIDGLETGSGRSLADPKHPDHYKPHVQEYMRLYGVKKVEANALVIRPEAGRKLCEKAILEWIEDGEEAVDRHEDELEDSRQELREAFEESVQNHE